MLNINQDFKNNLKSISKIAISIFLALLLFSILFVGYSKFENYLDKKEAAKYENIELWSYDIKENLQMEFSAKTKLVDGRLYAYINFEGYPEYLKDDRLAYKNSNAHIIVNFMEKDGFKLLTKSIQVKEMSLVVNKDGENIGMNYQFDESFGIDKYKNFSQVRVEWTLDTKIPFKKFVPIEVAKDTSLDHCAPGISKNERLKRLATNGVVRQTGYGEYTAGIKSIMIAPYSGDVISCN